MWMHVYMDGIMHKHQWITFIALQWRHNECDGVSNHRRLDCLLNRLFRRRSKKASKLCVTGLCEGKPSVTGGFPSQRGSDAENVSIWWRRHLYSWDSMSRYFLHDILILLSLFLTVVYMYMHMYASNHVCIYVCMYFIYVMYVFILCMVILWCRYQFLLGQRWTNRQTI